MRIIFAARDLKELRVNYFYPADQIASYFLKRILYRAGARFSQVLQNLLRYTKNRSIRTVFRYKFTIKPVIICVLYSVEALEYYQESPRLKSSSLDKTTICPQSTIPSPLMLAFRC